MSRDLQKALVILRALKCEIEAHAPALSPYIEPAQRRMEGVLTRELRHLAHRNRTEHFERRDATVQPRPHAVIRLFYEAVILVAALEAGVALPDGTEDALRLIAGRPPALALVSHAVRLVEALQIRRLGLAALHDAAPEEQRASLTDDERNVLGLYVENLPPGPIFIGPCGDLNRHLANAQRKLLGITSGAK